MQWSFRWTLSISLDFRMVMAARLGAKQALSATYRATGVASAIRRRAGRSRVGILVYHDPTPERLDAHLGYLRSRDIPVIPLDALVDALHTQDWSEIPGESVVLTFDDGHKRNAELTPVLERHDAHATVYLCSQVIDTHRRYWWNVAEDDRQDLKLVSNEERERLLEERYGFSDTREYDAPDAVSREDLETMKERFTFASHTRFHPILPACTPRRRASEIVDSRDEIEELTGTPCRHFAFPNGDFTDADVALARSAGYRSARSTRMGWNGPDTDPYALRIIGVDDTASVSCLAADLGGFGWLRQRVRDLQTETPGPPRRGAPEPSRERAPVTEQPALTR